MAAATVDSFIETLKKSGLVSEAGLQKHLQTLETENRAPQDARELIKSLVDNDVITLWQAEKLLAGKHKGFFLGKYKLLRLLGRGGMSAVYLAEHTLMKRRCAIKVLPSSRVNDSSYLGRFHLEAQAVAALDDPNIMRAYDVDHFVDGKNEVHFLVMEYVEGRNLHEIITIDGPLPPIDAAEYIRQSASGLTHAHEAGLVHRDIKPGNLLLDTKGVVKILDMGLARFFDDSDENSLTIQHDERVLGTADFLAPEQAINSHNVDARADIYSLGCTLYFLLTKHAPFEQGSLAQRLMAHQTQEPPAVSEYRNDIPESLIHILQTMMAKKADDRYQTASDVEKALRDWISDNADENWLEDHEKQWKNSGGKASTGVGSAIGAETPGPSAKTDEFGDFLTMIGKEAPLPTSGFSVADGEPKSSPGASGRRKSSPKNAGADSQSVLTEKSDITRNAGGSSKKSSVPVPPSKKSAPPASAKSAPPPAVEKKAESIIQPQPASAKQQPPSNSEPAPPVSDESQSPANELMRRFQEQPVLYGGALAAAIFLLAGMGYFLFGTSSDAPPENSITGTENTGENVASEKNGPAEIPESMPLVGVEILVGDGGTFTTLNEAIDYLIKYNDPFAFTKERVIKIKAGTVIKAPLELLDPPPNFPKKLKIISETEELIPWESFSSEPLISLKNVQGLHFERFIMKAEGKPTAISIKGRCPGVIIRNCRVESFQERGVELVGVSGLYNNTCRLENVSFTSPTAAATGVIAASGEANLEGIDIDRCRFIGPLQCGIDITADLVRWFKVRECLFHETDKGIQFQTPNPSLESFLISNNTFHKNSQAILYRGMPTPESNNIGIVRNLFFETVLHEAVMQQGFDPEGWNKLLMSDQQGISFNWTSRDPATAKEVIPLFANDGRTKVNDFKFQAVDPAAANFLKPADKKGGIPGAANYKPYVGAVQPW